MHNIVQTSLMAGIILRNAKKTKFHSVVGESTSELSPFIQSQDKEIQEKSHINSVERNASTEDKMNY